MNLDPELRLSLERAPAMRVFAPWSKVHERGWREAGEPDLLYVANLDPDIDWVDQLPLRGLAVNGTVDDDSAVARCWKLQVLGLNTDCELMLDLSGLSELQALSLTSDRIAGPLSLPGGVEDIALHGYRDHDLSRFRNFEALRSLTIRGRRLTRVPGASSALEFLEVNDARSLTSLDGIESYGGLRHLCIGGAKGLDLRPLAALTKLRKVELENLGVVRSLEPLLGLPCLEEVQIVGSTEIADRAIRSVAELPSMTLIALERWKRDYDMSPEDVRRHFGWDDPVAPRRLPDSSH